MFLLLFFGRNNYEKAAIGKYTMTDAELCMFTSNLAALMTRDGTEFAVKGVDAAVITALDTLDNAFGVFPPDSFNKKMIL